MQQKCELILHKPSGQGGDLRFKIWMDGLVSKWTVAGFPLSLSTSPAMCKCQLRMTPHRTKNEHSNQCSYRLGCIAGVQAGYVQGAPLHQRSSLLLIAPIRRNIWVDIPSLQEHFRYPQTTRRTMSQYRTSAPVVRSYAWHNLPGSSKVGISARELPEISAIGTRLRGQNPVSFQVIPEVSSGLRGKTSGSRHPRELPDDPPQTSPPS